MEVKKNLNNQQRKILDSVYTEQFDKVQQAMRDERAKGLAKVQTEVIKRLLKDKDVKKMMDAAATMHQLHRKLQKKLDGEGVYVDNMPSNETYLKFGRRYYFADCGTAPEVEEYEKKTREIELQFAEKKKEMRAKIWGASVTYEEAEAEIKELLKDIK